MTTITIHAPNRAFSGTSAGVVFRDGVGEADGDRDAAAIDYFTRRGYGLGTEPETPPAPERPVDAREPASVMVGTPLRDAAVDPQPGDYLPPTNAGEADPHGPLVVAPQIHGDGPKGIRSGDVHVDDPAEQAAAETELAERVLVAGEPHPTLEPIVARSASDGANHAPGVSAKKAAWVRYAVRERGASPSEADAATKAELIARYGG